MIGDFEYVQQRVALQVDVMRRHVTGVAEVVLAPRAAELRVLRLHARQLRVRTVHIDGVQANFEQLNFLGEVVDESYRDLATFDLFYRGAIVASKEGELIVEVPRDVTFQEDEEDAEDSSNLSDPQDEDEHDEETEVGTHKEQKLVLDAWDLDRLPKSSTGYKAVVVRVEYDIDEPSGGLRDTLRDACTFRIELTVPDWCVAVCSGQMVQQVLNPEVDADGVQWRTFRYVVNPKTNCSSIGFAVGPFRLYVPPEMPRMTHFALPECFEDLVHCTSKLASTMTYFERALGASYPFKTYQQVFVEDLPDQLQYIAGGAVLDQNLLHGPRIIDRELPSHLAQVKALVGSWIGGAVGIQSTKDAWVLIGVIGHLVNTYVRSIYGEEEYGYRIQLAMDALTTIELTTDQQSPALHSSEVDVYSEYDPLSLTLLEVKAPLVLHMIEQRVGPKHLSIAIQRAVSGGGAGATNGTSGGGDASAPNGDGNKDEETSKANDDKKSGGRDGDDDGALFHRPHEKPNVMSCRVLTECMSGLTTHSRRLRAEAAQSLGIWQSIHAPLTNANTQLPIWKGMHNLFRIFKEHFFDRVTDMPLPNYFLPSGGRVILEALGAQEASISSKQIQVQDYAAGEYEIKKSIPKALAMIRAQNSKSPPEIETFLLQLLTENDNSKNYVEMGDQSQVADDCYYIGNLVLSLSVLSLDQPARADDGDFLVVREILRYLHYDQVQPSYNKTITVCCLEALCNLVLVGRCEEKLVNFHSFASPKHSNLVRKAAIESILRLYFAEDPNGPSAGESSSSSMGLTFSSVQQKPNSRAKAKGSSSLLSKSYGATAAMLWLCELLKAEQSPGIRLFAVQVCLNCMRGFPPGVGKEVLATWDHSYTLGLMNSIEMKEPTSFVLKSPEKDKILTLFDRPNLSKLRDDSSSAKRIVEELWSLMNSTAAMDQRLRVALIVLYRKVWGEATPLSVAHIVQDKPANWAGGYESLRLMMEDSKNRMMMNGGRGGNINGSDANSGLGRKSDDDRKRGFSSAASSSADAALEQFRGKKFKFKMGDTTFRSHKL
ncbi:Transcription initiation factor TFIID subunit 2 [Phytophthora ramorum]|nr:Transcription initiation factor TFIID subunit 2 [Phytophthora ramorum]